jgi:cytochrome c-type protein NapC
MKLDKVKAVLSAALARIHATGWLGLAAMFVVGIVCWTGFNAVLESTNTEAFCISCHEMQSTVYEEYRMTIHASNRSGVRATCPDCHVPKSFGPKMAAKLRASKDVYHNMLGTIDTPEKFNARRLQMAEAVWVRMKESDSRECRGCHDNQSFDYAKQNRRSIAQHEAGLSEGKTCIDCHKGVAHRLPAVEQSIGAEKGGATQEIFHPVPVVSGGAKQ